VRSVHRNAERGARKCGNRKAMAGQNHPNGGSFGCSPINKRAYFGGAGKKAKMFHVFAFF